MKLTIRDLLWLALLLASLTAMGVQRFQPRNQIGPLFRGHQIGPSKSSVHRQALREKYATFTDQQLDEELASMPDSNAWAACSARG